MAQSNYHNQKKGEVVSLVDAKTVKIQFNDYVLIPKYRKVQKSDQRFLVHNQLEKVKVGDQVLISEIRPKSKRKKFEVVKILTTMAEKAKGKK